MNRKRFFGLAAGLAAAELLQASPEPERKMHLVTLSFDDGFRKSSIKTAEIYEKYGLSACINVIATGHSKDFYRPSRYLTDTEKGNFALWNELKARGHEIMPHGYSHSNLTELSFDQARDLVLRCLDVFSRELRGFEPSKAVFNFPYNASTPELEQWLPSVVRAFRTGHEGLNPLPFEGMTRLTCTSFGPESCEEHLDSQIALLLSRPVGWLIYNTHGLDGEGWGPIRSSYLERLLDRLLQTGSVRILPAGRALDLYG